MLCLKIKQSIIIERKTFDFELVFINKVRVLKIMERRKNSSAASIHFRATLIPWLCSVIDQACREASPLALDLYHG